MDPLGEMFRHHAWATLELIDHCAHLPEEQLRKGTLGTYGTMLATLVHLVAADQRYLERLTGEASDPCLREGMEPPLRELRFAFEQQIRRWKALLDGVNELDVTMPARSEWPQTPHAEDLLLLQAIHHGNDHRTQICTVLATLGLEAPDLDGWAYWSVTRHGVSD